MLTIRPARPVDRDPLVDIWSDSVRATHQFLSEDDFRTLLPLMREVVMPNLEELWIVCSRDDQAVGFMSLRGQRLDALFIAPSRFRLGAGRQLVDHARRLKGRLLVSVNEQKLPAVAFYAAVGFEVIGRSALDDEGRPFPLLHMQDAASQKQREKM